MFLTTYVVLLLLFVLSIGSVIGSSLRHKHDERFQSIVLKGFYLSWFISFLGVTTGFSLSMLSFVNLPENMAVNICMYSVLLSGIFNGLYVYISHKRF